MPSRIGRGNRLRWDTKEMLNTLANSTTQREVVAGFREMAPAAKLDLLVRLADSLALSGSDGGSDRAK